MVFHLVSDNAEDNSERGKAELFKRKLLQKSGKKNP